MFTQFLHLETAIHHRCMLPDHGVLRFSFTRLDNSNSKHLTISINEDR